MSGGFWSSNIGNCFMQLGIERILERAAPDKRLVTLGDQPAWWHPKLVTPKNAFNLLDYVRPDFMVVYGIFLNRNLENIWGKTLKILHSRKVKIIALGVGMTEYNDREIKRCRSFLSHYPFHVLVSRDGATYKYFSDLAEHAYNGIDPAFFIPDRFRPLPIEGLGKYIMFTFDKIPEPRVIVSDRQTREDGFFEFNGKRWKMLFPNRGVFTSRRFSRLKKLYASSSQRGDMKIRCYYIAGGEKKYRETYPEKIDGFLVIRPDHRSNPMVAKDVFKKRNSFAFDSPYSYLNLYAKTAATFSDRVHACIATLAYGRPAMLFNPTPRIGIFERLGIDNITKKLESLPEERLKAEKDSLISFLKNTLQKK